MDRSHSKSGGRLAAFVAAGLVVTSARLVRVLGADEPSGEDVKARALEVDFHMRGAEKALARSLQTGISRSDARSEAADATVSLAKLLAAARDDGRRAAAAMQWLIDNAPG